MGCVRVCVHTISITSFGIEAGAQVMLELCLGYQDLSYKGYHKITNKIINNIHPNVS